jgi:hypothetical protein
MFGVFLDESGTHAGSRVTAVAGYVVSEESLLLLEREWIASLNEHQIDELHMKEFVPPYGKQAAWDESKKRALLEPLIALIHRHSSLGVGAAVVMDEFMQSTHARALAAAPGIIFSPYQWCLRFCINQVAEWADANGHDGPFDYTLDQGDTNRHWVTQDFNDLRADSRLRQKYRLGSINFEDSQRVPALQCADLLAYEMYKEMDRLLSQSERRTRGSFVALFRENDRLGTVKEDPIKDQILRTIKYDFARITLLPPREKFQILCAKLRSVTDFQRDTLFEMMPALRTVYASCIESEELGVRWDELPPGSVPPEDPSVLLPLMCLSFEELSSKFIDPPKARKEIT